MIVLYLVMLYLLSGFVFSLWFISKGMKKLDESTHESTWGFKLIIIPGTVLLWVIILMKYRAKRNDL